jgi:hypothetical protein
MQRSSVFTAAVLSGVVGMAASAHAGTVTLGVPDPQVSSLAGTVMDARYRISNTNWDHMISTSSSVSVSTLVQTANRGNHDQLNGAAWDFTLDYSPVTGWSFVLNHAGGGSPNATTSSVAWSAPFNSVSPFRSFNGFELFAVTNVTGLANIASGLVTVENLAFSAPGHTVVGSLGDLVTSNGLVRNVISADFDLSTTAWTLSGRVRASYVYANGASTPGSNLDERLKFDIKATTVTLIPTPGAAAALALGLLAAGRRRR